MTENMSAINILHITDLHYKLERAFNQKVVLDALLRDIASRSENYGEPDLIVFSGDLVHNADDKKVYEILYDDFIEQLLDISNCDHSRLYLVPGNHDVQRSKVELLQSEQELLEKECINRDELNARYISGSLSSFSCDKSKNFFDFQSFFESEGKLFANEIVQVYDLPEKGLCLLCLNTAWMGVAGINKVSDLRKLLVPEAALVDAVNHIPKDRFVIGAHHHPTSWLTEFCEADFKDFLGATLDLQLVGHVHDPRPIVFKDANGSTFQNQSGALYTWREDRYLGYSSIRIEPELKFIEVCWRSYYDKRRCFDEATNINDKSGWLYSSSKAEDFFSSLFDDYKIRDIKEWAENILGPYFEEEFNMGISDRPTNEVFVAPPLSKQTFVEGKKEEDSDEFVESAIDFDELSQGTDNAIIQAYPEYGRTTLLQQLCRHSCSRTTLALRDRHFIPVFLEFSDFQPGTQRVQRAIRNGLPDLPKACTVDTLLRNGAFSIFIDDVLLSNEKGMAELRTFISKNKQNRFVLSTLSLSHYDGVQIDVGLPVHFERITLAPFRRKDIRSLVRKWQCPQGSEEELLERMMRELRAINVPHTPVNSTLLLDIISNDEGFSPLNRPSLIERFIETLLKKRSLSEIERRKFDFRNQVHYLGHIAEHMCRIDSYVLSFESLVQITDSYLKNLGLGYSAREIIDSSITSRIFHDRKSDGSISFRFRAFLEFFVAAQMRTDTSFRDWVFDEERFLRFPNEIEYYAGLERNDLDLLRIVSERHKTYVKNVFGEKLLDRMSGLGEEVVPESLEANLRYSQELAEQIGEQPMTADERDELLDAEIPTDAEGRQEVFRPLVESKQDKYIVSLMMYTALVKNTELINDAEKRIHLAEVLNSWGLTVWGSFLSIPSLVKNRRVNINGVTYVISYPKEYSDDRVAKLISVNIPKEIARLLYSLIGTEKLEVQLSQGSLSENEEPRLIEFFRCSLYMDLRFNNWWKIPAQFSQRSKDSRYFQEVMLGKAVDIHRMGALPKPIALKLEGEIVESYAKLYAPSPKQVQELRSKKKASMSRARLLSALKAKIDGDEG